MPRAPLATRNPFPPGTVLWLIWDQMDWTAFLQEMLANEEIAP